MQFLDNEIMVKSKKKNKILIINKIQGFFVHVTCYDCLELEKKNVQGHAYSELHLTSLLIYL